MANKQGLNKNIGLWISYTLGEFFKLYVLYILQCTSLVLPDTKS